MPVMSAGIRSGVNWIRLNVQSMTSAIVRTSIVLPRPGTPSSRTWLLARRPVRVWRTSSRWPTMTRPTSRSMACARSANASGARRGGGRCGGRAAPWRPPVVRAPIASAPLVIAWRVERAEVVAHVVLDRERDVAAIERGLGVLLEVRIDLLVRGQRAVVRAAARCRCPAGSGRRRRSRRRTTGRRACRADRTARRPTTGPPRAGTGGSGSSGRPAGRCRRCRCRASGRSSRRRRWRPGPAPWPCP